MTNLHAEDFSYLDVSSNNSKLNGILYLYIYNSWSVVANTSISSLLLSPAVREDYTISDLSESLSTPPDSYYTNLYFTDSSILDSVSLGSNTLLNLKIPAGTHMYIQGTSENDETISSERSINISAYINSNTPLYIYLYPGSYITEPDTTETSPDSTETNTYVTSRCQLNAAKIATIKATISAAESAGLIGWDSISTDWQALLIECEPDYAAEKMVLSESYTGSGQSNVTSSIKSSLVILLILSSIAIVLYLLISVYNGGSE